MLSQFFILSSRGDTLITRDFRGDLVKSTHDIFFHKAKTWRGDPPPVMNIEGINFLHIKKHGLYLLAVSPRNISASFAFETLQQLTSAIKDFCGVFSEEAIRKNFVLIYEILDEMMDYGYPQLMSTDQVRAYLVNEPVIVRSQPLAGLNTIISPNVIPPTVTDRPIVGKKQKNEIFVDVFERVSVLFNAGGYIITSNIDGCIKMKSFLRDAPELRLGLNEDLVVGRDASSFSSCVALEDCNFHERVNTAEFDQFRILTINPPDGEFVVMNYRITREYQTPFRIVPFVETLSPYRLELIVKLRCCVPKNNYGANVQMRVNLPHSVNSVTMEKPKTLSGQETVFAESEKVAQWNIKKFPGSSEHTIKFVINSSEPIAAKALGPVSLAFEIPTYTVSNLSIKYLRIAGHGKSEPCKWIRYVTQASSYVCRI